MCQRVLSSMAVALLVSVFFLSTLAPPGRLPRVCSGVVSVNCAESCACCDVACRCWSARGASAALTPPAFLRATSSACSQSGTWLVARASQEG